MGRRNRGSSRARKRLRAEGSRFEKSKKTRDNDGSQMLSELPRTSSQLSEQSRSVGRPRNEPGTGCNKTRYQQLLQAARDLSQEI